MFDWYGKTVRQLLECCLATKILKDFVESLDNGLEVPYILCGDFNIEPHFPAYKALSSKTLSDEDINEVKMNKYVRFSSDVATWPDPTDFIGKVYGVNSLNDFLKELL